MSLVLILAIIAVGILFIFVEFFFVPGFSIISILGGVVAGIGIYSGYNAYGQTIGNWMLISSVIISGIIMYWGYRRALSKKWALQTNSDGKVNNESLEAYKVGDVGKTITNLRPEGKAVFTNDERITVYSVGEFIEKDTMVQIIKIDHNKIFVKPHN